MRNYISCDFAGTGRYRYS
ncbi:MAG TPA: hypothetical protein EYO88_06835 [Alphaproteobacteria bacterium]|nr:hypothetical protein [Alphaproteobacteria bacterium]